MGAQSRFRVFVAMLALLVLGGCGLRDCALGIAHHDCYAEGSSAATFPQDDAICRRYGLRPGTHDYRVCRVAKNHERALTAHETNFGFLRDPLTPDIR